MKWQKRNNGKEMTTWQKLEQHHTQLSAQKLNDLFASDPARFSAFSVKLDGMLVDYSKNNITAETIQLLCDLARETGLEAARDRMFAGNKINHTEDRAVLHVRLRDGVEPQVQETLTRMATFTEKIQADANITDIVHIGIGGSYLGPEAAVLALKHLHHPRLTLHFVSNVEPSALHHTLSKVDVKKTLFIIASKTFTTAETMLNAKIAREHGAIHFAALTSNVEAARAFGIDDAHIFPMWDWVGGRYSLWSSVGLPVMLMIGVDGFRDMLAGAHLMDTHFKTAPLHQNLPVIMGLIGVWYRNFCNYGAYACIPYHAGLARMPAWLQQLDMESNGKAAKTKTGPIIFGEPGTDAQHSFFQWLHQGTDIVPVEFIAAATSPVGSDEQQRVLLANCLAQSRALMTGIENVAEPHRNFTGNRPSTTIMLDALTPHTLGMLFALYEHRVFVQGIIWKINSFDQFGVELGKVMAKSIETALNSGAASQQDASTSGLISHILKRKN